MRRSLLLAVAFFATIAAPAAAHSDPPGCVNSNLELSVASGATAVRPGAAVNFTVYATNVGAGACNVTDATVTLRLPTATGSSSGELKTLTTTGSYPAGTVNAVVGTGAVPYTVAVNAGVIALGVRANASFTAHTGTPDETDTAQKSLNLTVTQPALVLTAVPSPTSGLVPLTATVNYLLKNTSSTTVAMSNAVITDPGCTTVGRIGGDSNGNNLLDNGESWAYSCQFTLQKPAEVHANVTASAMNPVDSLPVNAARVPWTVIGTAPPRPHLTLTKTASPTSGTVPFTTVYTYTVVNDGDPAARPVEEVTVDDAGCSPAVVLAPDPELTVGEQLVFKCSYALVSPITITSTAVASGADGYDGARIYTNQSSTTVTASSVPVVVGGPETTPIVTPTPTPTPTPESENAAAPLKPTLSTRVKFAYAGRFASATSCRGTAVLTLTAGTKKVATKRVKLDSKCRFKVSFDVARSRLAKATKVTVTAKATGKRTVAKKLTVPKR